MARPPNIVRLKEAWAFLGRGGSNNACGVHHTFASLMRRLIEEGWEWKRVERALKAGATLQSIVDQLGGEVIELPPPAPKPPPKPKPEKPLQMEVIAPEPGPARDHWRVAVQEQLSAQKRLLELEIETATRFHKVAMDRLDTVEAFPFKKIKTSEKIVPCPECQHPIVQAVTHIHPGKPDFNGIIKLAETSFNRWRLARNMPRSVLAIRIDGGELGEQLERVNEAFKTAFTDGIKGGLVTEQAAVEIWEIARRLIDGANAENTDNRCL